MLGLHSIVLLACTAAVSARPAESKRWWPLSVVTSTLAELGPGFEMRQSPNAQCDLSNAQLPQASPTPLPPVDAGLSLFHVAVGRGTQNYTCATGNPDAAPAAIGALATLYNVSCMAADMPQLLARIPDIALNMPQPSDTNSNSPMSLAISGHHYFVDLTTPFFNLNTANADYGMGAFKKVAAVPAPAGSMVGQNNQGNGAAPWLRLVAKNADEPFKNVYRVNTAGGQAPATCAGQPAAFQVQYSAEYWFFA